MPFAASTTSPHSFAQTYTCLSVFLFFAISLVVPSGYSVGSALLFLAGLGLVARPGLWPRLQRDDKIILWVFGLFFLWWVVEILLDGVTVSRFDKPVRIICAMLALLWLLRHPPKPACFWGGIASGAIAVGGWAIWQKLALGIDRAGGYTLVIQFGNLSMLLGMLCLAGVGWAWFYRRSAFWSVVLLAGFFCGLIGSLFSGSRGGWIGAPFVLLLVLFGYRDRLPKYATGGFVAVVALMIALLYALPSLGIKPRVEQAVSDVQLYFSEGKADTSVGARFEMWRTGAMIVRESPWVGMGGEGMEHYTQLLVEQGKVDPFMTHFGHLHNDFIDVAARRGLLGLCLLLALYLLPLRLFSARLRQGGSQQARPYALAGSVLCVSYIDFGMSQTFLSHNSGVMVFFFCAVICWAMMRHSETLPSSPAAYPVQH